MREKIEGLTQTIKQILRNSEAVLGLEEIYDKVENSIQLTPEQKETTYGRPNYQHSVRRILTMLVDRREAI
jgi:precorrin-6B methylase 1